MPFFRTAFVSDKGTARETKGAEDIYHFNGVRLRANGQGNLKLKLFSLDDAREQALSDYRLSENSGRQLTVLANFTEQRVSLEVRTYNINDYFRINRIVIFSRWRASSFPQ